MSTSSMNITPLDDTTLAVALEGRLDVPGVDGVETWFTAALVPSGKNAIVDMSGVEFVASLGIRMFVSVARALARDGRKIALYGCNAQVAEIMEMADLDKLMSVTADADAARAALPA